jgi:hypothetical protein
MVEEVRGLQTETSPPPQPLTSAFVVTGGTDIAVHRPVFVDDCPVRGLGAVNATL